jgi:apolipoprotein D and lipocalin family protein
MITILKSYFIGAFMTGTVLSSGLSASPRSMKPLETVPQVDLQRYLGQWYEIARLPNSFQKFCVQSTAEYAMREDGQISVTNRCSQEDGALDEAVGVAQIRDVATNAKLRVSFLPSWLRWTGIGWGKYWIIDLDSHYQFAVVSEPNREYLWILNRQPQMKREIYNGIVVKLRAMDFDLSKLIVSGDLI